MTCYGHWELDVDLGDGEVVQLCARYSGVSRAQITRICEWCCFNRDIDDALGYHQDLAEGMEWK